MRSPLPPLLAPFLLFASTPALADWQSFDRVAHEEPNVPDPYGVFHGAEDRGRAELADGMLACRVSASAAEEWDSFRGPDLLLRLRVASARERWRAARDNAHHGYVTIPRARLRRGDRVSVRVEDRDAFGNELVGSRTFRWDGRWPLLADLGPGSIECRRVPLEVVDAGAARAESRVNTWLRGARAARFDAQAYDLGRPSHLEGSARVAGLAAWRGRRNAQVRRARREVDAALAEARRRVHEGLVAFVATLPDVDRDSGRQVVVERAAARLRRHDVANLDVDVITEDARVVPLAREASALPQDAIAVRVRAGQARAVWLRVR
jgi:hypothetical protein